jgi:ribosome-binding factor A
MKPYRKEKVASLIHEIVSETIAHHIGDPRVSAFTTVTRVELTGDLLLAKVYVSVMGDEATERLTMAGIHHASGHIQRRVAAGVRLRLCPQLRFHVDEAAKRARQTLEILAENRARNPGLYENLPAEGAASGELSAGIAGLREGAAPDADSASEPDDGATEGDPE